MENQNPISPDPTPTSPAPSDSSNIRNKETKKSLLKNKRFCLVVLICAFLAIGPAYVGINLFYGLVLNSPSPLRNYEIPISPSLTPDLYSEEVLSWKIEDSTTRAGWKKYTELENNYSVEYPNDTLIRITCSRWRNQLHLNKRNEEEAREFIEYPACGRSAGAHESIEIAVFPITESDESWKDGIETSYDLTITTQTITVAGIKARKSITKRTSDIGGPPFPDFLEIIKISNDNKSYTFTLADEALQNTFDQILFTFRFD